MTRVNFDFVANIHHNVSDWLASCNKRTDVLRICRQSGVVYYHKANLPSEFCDLGDQVLRITRAIVTMLLLHHVLQLGRLQKFWTTQILPHTRALFSFCRSVDPPTSFSLLQVPWCLIFVLRWEHRLCRILPVYFTWYWHLEAPTSKYDANKRLFYHSKKVKDLKRGEQPEDIIHYLFMT